jgi:hypothetical protein
MICPIFLLYIKFGIIKTNGEDGYIIIKPITITMIKIVDLTDEELKIIDEWKETEAVTIKYFTYESNNIFYEISKGTVSYNTNGCSYHFKTTNGEEVIINIRTILKNPNYFEKI